MKKGFVNVYKNEVVNGKGTRYVNYLYPNDTAAGYVRIEECFMWKVRGLGGDFGDWKMEICKEIAISEVEGRIRRMFDKFGINVKFVEK